MKILAYIQISTTFGTFQGQLGKYKYDITKSMKKIFSFRRYSRLLHKIEDQPLYFPLLFRGKRFFPPTHGYLRRNGFTSQSPWANFSPSQLGVNKRPDVLLVTMPWTKMDFIPKLWWWNEMSSSRSVKSCKQPKRKVYFIKESVLFISISSCETLGVR